MRTMIVLGAMAMAGCGGATQESPRETTPTAPEEGGEAKAIPPEKFEEIDHFFRNKGADLQFACYNPAVEKHHKKFEGSVTIAVMVEPGGKADQIKVVNSSVGSSDIDDCVKKEAASWDWPDVPAAAPYSGTVTFKPAW